MEISLSSSDTRGKGDLVDAVNTDDRISTLSKDLLLKILSSLSTKEVVRTSVLSKRWGDVWKETSEIFMDMRYIKISRYLFIDFSPYAAGWMTKVINDHSGNFERFTIYHFAHQCVDGMVEAWIRSLIHVKHVKHLTLINCFGPFVPNSILTLDLPPKSFSHPNLKSLHLGRYNLKDPHGFDNCWNLKKLKLIAVFAEIEVFNVVLMSCPSLEVLVVDLHCHKQSGPLKIENRNLKFLCLSCCSQIDGIEVATPSLEILTVKSLSCEIEKFVIANPNLQFNRNYWVNGKLYPHTSYYISCPPDQDKTSIGHEVMMSEPSEYMKFYASMSVSIDLTNTKEVDMLKEVLAAWPDEMQELEILFKKSNAPRKEGETPIGRTKRKFWEETKPFPNGHFRVHTVWLFNFSGSKEEFALASRLITQGTVVMTMKIQPASISLSNKSEIEAAVTKLKELPKGHTELSIVMF
ncbi:unnamed protein product [Arabidopsis arenosa]|uniref:F-box domain-containing protein n=1 Tax=Arabidopsis arenosa TaxID=38785 RepID=A0A8S2B3K7_ARAAE|nr:unnamed protein product [Arabidopsis arenosa]